MEPDHPSPALPQSFFSKIKKMIVGPARNLKDPSVGHHLSLIAFLAWVGLGADGLSSSLTQLGGWGLFLVFLAVSFLPANWSLKNPSGTTGSCTMKRLTRF